MSHRAALIRTLSVFAVAIGAAGCSASNGVGGPVDARSPDSGAFDAAPDSHAPGLDTGSPTQPTLLSLQITPMNGTLVAGPGMQNTLAFQLVGVESDGTHRTLTNGAWSLDTLAIGSIGTANGLFTANGSAGGIVRVSAQVPGPGGSTLETTTSLTVQLQVSLDPAGVTPPPSQHFTSPGVTDPTRQVNLVYPLAGAVMPNNVAPPDVQWSGGAIGDAYRIQIHKTDVAINGYVVYSAATFTFDWQVDQNAWRAILESDPDDLATVQVDRYDASSGQVVLGTPITVRFAHAPIFGQVYYWDLSGGVLLRIDAVTATRTPVIPNPPAQPGVSPANQCVACHAISNDGRYLSAELWAAGDQSTVFDLTANLSTNPAPTVFPPGGGNYLFSSFNPSATRLVTNPGVALGLLDPTTGAAIAGSGLPTSGASHPSWSPNGNSIAYIGNTDGPWAVDFTTGDLSSVTETGTDTFGTPTVLHTGSSLSSSVEGGNADSHPTWSPDSAWIAFGHGTHSRSNTRDAANNPVYQPGAVYLVAQSGGAPMRLNNAVGGPSGASGYWPTFSPFQTAEPNGAPGYYWLAFYSRRDYGNAQAGTMGTQRRQLWVTAVSAAPSASADPSNIPYWLPGQDSTTENMAAYWAPTACRVNTADCAVSSDCCSGLCLADPENSGMSTCQSPPANMCHTSGQTCGGASDCCTGLLCDGNVCQAAPG